MVVECNYLRARLQYPGSVNMLVAQALLLASRDELITASILADLDQSLQMLSDFGFQCSRGTSSILHSGVALTVKPENLKNIILLSFLLFV